MQYKYYTFIKNNKGLGKYEESDKYIHSPSHVRLFMNEDGSVVRLNNKGEQVEGDLYISLVHNKTSWTVWLWIGNHSEAWAFKNKEVAERTYNKCMDLMSANYADENERLTDITVCLEGAKDTPNSTLEKTSNDSAENVTITDTSIPTNTELSFILNEFMSLDEDIWNSGSIPSYAEED